MALQQGRCKNCGSIIMVDRSKDDAVCMFCWAHTAPAEAIEIDANPSAYEFLNETQDAPSSEDQAQAFSHMSGNAAPVAKKSQPAPKKRKAEKLTPAEKVAQTKKDLFEPHVPKKQRLLMLLSGVGLCVLIAAIALPMTLNRNAKRETIAAQINKLVPNRTIAAANFAIAGQSNNQLTLVIPEKISQDQALQLMAGYKKIRAGAYGLADSDAQDEVKLQLYTEEGLFRINGEGVKLLPNSN